MTSDQEKLRDELLALIEARRELSREEETYLVESFLNRLDADIDTRIEQKIGARGSAKGASPAVLVVALVFAIPLCAIAASAAQGFGLLIALIAIVTIVSVYYGTQS